MNEICRDLRYLRWRLKKVMAVLFNSCFFIVTYCHGLYDIMDYIQIL